MHWNKGRLKPENSREGIIFETQRTPQKKLSITLVFRLGFCKLKKEIVFSTNSC